MIFGETDASGMAMLLPWIMTLITLCSLAPSSSCDSAWNIPVWRQASDIRLCPLLQKQYETPCHQGLPCANHTVEISRTSGKGTRIAWNAMGPALNADDKLSSGLGVLPLYNGKRFRDGDRRRALLEDAGCLVEDGLVLEDRSIEGCAHEHW